VLVGFGGSRHLNDGQFCSKFQVSVMVGFGGLRDLNDCRFWWVTRSQ